jgi:competence protein ComEC
VTGHDLRLALPAVAAWLVAWQGRLVPPVLLCGLALVAIAVGALVLALSTADRAALVAAVLACAAAAALATAARVHARTTGPLAVAARTQAAVVVEGTVVDDPRSVPPKGDVLAFRPLVAARLRVTELRVAGRSLQLRQPVLVLSADESWLRLLPSRRVRVEGRLQDPGRGSDVAAVLSARGPPVVLSAPSPVQRVAGRVRAGLRDAAAGLPPDERGLLPGLVDGDTSRLLPALRDDFRTTGLTHLVAVSGTNVAVVLGAALLALSRLGVGLRWRPPLAGLVLLGFVVLARPSPSVLRAAAMGVIALVALATGARRQALPALCAAVLGLVLLSPELAAQPGFALSTLATAGLLLVAPVWRERLQRRLPRWLAEAIAVPAAAQLACTPVVVALSGQLGLLAVPANMLAVPAVAPATVLGVLAALVAPVWLPAAKALAWVAWLPTHWLVLVARTGARQPGAGLTVATGWAGALTVLVLLVAGAVVLRSPLLRRAAASVLVGVLLVAVVLVVVRPGWPPKGWVVASCDVGQGDGFAVRLAPTAALVIDNGPDPERIDRCLRRLGVRRVPLLVLTHLHADHVEGVPGLLRGRRVGAVEIGPLDEPAVERQRLTGWLTTAHVPVVRAGIGEVREQAGVRWEVLDATARHGTDSDPNNSSIVIRLQTHGVRVLFSGDLEGEAQAELLSRGVDLRADVLKVPHHGSAKQDPAFLDAVRARVALTPVGAGNPYGHPSARTLRRLEEDGARTYRSDRDGDVAVVVRAGRVTTVGRGGDGVAPARVAAHPHALQLAAVVTPVPAALGVPAVALTLCDAVAPSPVVVPGPPARARSPPYRGRPWDHGRVPSADLLVPLTLVVGDEELLAARAVSAVVAAARERTPDIEVRDLEGAEVQPGDLAEALSPSLFGDDRVVVVRAAQDLAKEVAAEVTAYAADPVSEMQLVVVHAGGAKGKALVTALLAAGARRVDVPKLTRPSERKDFVRGELRASGRKATDDGLDALLEAVGSDLRELAAAVSQLLADTEGTITEAEVRRYHSGRAETSGFQIADKALAGDLAGALELARWSQSTGLAPVLITSALASALRSVGIVASAGKAPTPVLAGQLGMPTWKVEQTQRQARGWDPGSLTRALLAVADADAQVKGEGADKDYAIEKMLLTVTQARGGGR